MGENDEMIKHEKQKPQDGSGVVVEELAATLAALVRDMSGEGGPRQNGFPGGELTSNFAPSGPSEIKLDGRSPVSLSVLTSTLQGVAPVMNRSGGSLGWLSSINPLLGLLKLFGGRSRTEEIELPKYERPSRQQYSGGISGETGWAPRAIDYGAGWQMRTAEPERAAANPQITVNVQAIDSRSFLDHREDIAAAVRQALLESHSLSDVIGER